MGKMIEVEGFKAFRGVMNVRRQRISGSGWTWQRIRGEWLYKPDTNCWYCRGRSFPAECCEVLEVNYEES